MINLKNRIIKLGSETYTLDSFEVWFVGPLGLCKTVGEAVEVCDTMGLDCETNIRPISVAVNVETGIYEQV